MNFQTRKVILAEQLDSSCISMDKPCYVFLIEETVAEKPLIGRKRGFNVLGVGVEFRKFWKLPGVPKWRMSCHVLESLNAIGMKQILIDVRSLSVDKPSFCGLVRKE